MVLNAVNSLTADLEIEQSEQIEFIKVDAVETTIEEPKVAAAPTKPKNGMLTRKLIKKMEEENVRELRTVT